MELYVDEWKYNINRYFRGEIWRRERRWNRVKEKSVVLVCFSGWLTIDYCEQFRTQTQLHFYPNISKPCCLNFFLVKFLGVFLYIGGTPHLENTFVQMYTGPLRLCSSVYHTCLQVSQILKK